MSEKLPHARISHKTANRLLWFVKFIVVVVTSVTITYIATSAYCWRSYSTYGAERPEALHRLRRVVYSIQPALNEVRTFIEANGHPPSEEQFKTLKGMTPMYLETCFSFDHSPRTEYLCDPDGKNFSFNIHTSFDAMAVYQSANPRWMYWTDGASAVEIEL